MEHSRFFWECGLSGSKRRAAPYSGPGGGGLCEFRRWTRMASILSSMSSAVTSSPRRLRSIIRWIWPSSIPRSSNLAPGTCSNNPYRARSDVEPHHKRALVITESGQRLSVNACIRPKPKEVLCIKLGFHHLIGFCEIAFKLSDRVAPTLNVRIVRREQVQVGR